MICITAEKVYRDGGGMALPLPGNSTEALMTRDQRSGHGSPRHARRSQRPARQPAAASRCPAGTTCRPVRLQAENLALPPGNGRAPQSRPRRDPVTMPVSGPGPAGWWLRGAAAVLAMLAAAAGAVSWQAQYVMVLSIKHSQAVAAAEAAIPDAGAVIFASLGVALALHGRHALRPRALNAACIAISLTMNVLAAGHGWRDLAVWVMPAAVYALASDTLIGVIRAQAAARQQPGRPGPGGDAPGLLSAAGGATLWLLRLLLAGPSTLRGFRAWVIEECPVAPGRTAAPDTRQPAAASTPPRPPRAPRQPRPGGTPTKRDRLFRLAAGHRDLACIPPGEVSRLATELAHQIGYSPGTARRELIRHVRALQAGPAPAIPPRGEGSNA
jgi:hypothetical protein